MNDKIALVEKKSDYKILRKKESSSKEEGKATEKSDDQRNEIMLAEYKVLEKERRALKQRLARLKHYMWGLKFEKDKAKHMNEVLLNAHKLIKNPDMLGAFSDVKNIRDERRAIRMRTV